MLFASGLILPLEVGPVQLLTIREVAALLRVPTARAYALARADLLPVVRIGRQIRIDEAALRGWISRGGQPLPGDAQATPPEAVDA